METNDPYREAAEVKKPVKAEDMPSRPEQQRTSMEREQTHRSGPGVRSTRAESEPSLRSED